MHLGIIGFGSIARALIAQLSDGDVAQIPVLVRLSALDTVQAEFQSNVRLQFVATLDALIANGPDLIVECASHAAVTAYAKVILAQGISLVVASIGAFAQQTFFDQITTVAHRTGARLILPSGAIGGLDLLSVLAASNDVKVAYSGIKPPDA